MERIPFASLKRQHETIEAELQSAFTRVLSHHEFIQGKEVSQFEDAWAKFLGAKFAIGCSNGTDALILALRATGVSAGDEVITVSHTFFATIEAIVSLGAKPVFVDIEPATGLIDVSRLEAAITSQTKAIVPVHLYGYSAEMEKIVALAKKHRLYCVEDAAQAHGTQYQRKSAGTFGDAGCFSFYPGKNLGALGDAGIVVTDDSALAEELRSLRDHGRAPGKKYEHREFAANMRMDGLQAAFLLAKLPHLSAWNKRRAEIAGIYQKELPGLPDLTLPPALEGRFAGTSLHLYVVRHPKRDWLAQELQGLGVETGIHYPKACHEQPAYREKFPSCRLPQTEKFAETCLSLPLSGSMSPAEAKEVSKRIRKLLGG